MLLRLILCALLLAAPCVASAAPAASPAAIPPEVDAALVRAKIPREAVSLLVQEADTTDATHAAPRLSHRAQVAMNPASVMKLTTTFAALDLLGPAYAWTTPVFVDGALESGTLYGNVYIQGLGDPKLVLERLWLLLRRLQGLGIRQINGDIVLDRSAFEVPETNAADFDGEPLRPYNAAPDALLINYKAVVMTITPDRANRMAQIQFDPPLAGVEMQATVPLSAGDCGDYRAALKADFSEARRIRFAGSYAASCGEKVWPVAYADPRSYAPRAVQGLWQELGGKLGGSVRWGTLPAALAAGKPTLEMSSAPLAEIIRDINKYSNNVMAQQVFLTLGRVLPGALGGADATAAEAPLGNGLGTGSTGGSTTTPPLPAGNFAASRAVLQRWWKVRIGSEDLPVWDNGSGLSRQERISAQGLARMLQVAWRSPYMPELVASLPITGVDGTLKRVKSRATGSAHLKTGSLSNVLARAGYVDGASGKRYVLVALINHANANTDAARAVMETLVDWAARDN
ncbi:D-alanyl-D-alanine carboxypeptidase/D-alanyl-D-alanine-endopeptidase [Rhodoferax lacus]|uniref:D-alanyl-D-alanine carboxypeptidase/D-alanyl-D-alanine-endopeptidase n=1 Tax=Rhodoferax lacus TaxID=2184758 RepID=A0A3E1RCB9_9BURK|nr:D-alanyl-D-alanine carboxypeptidase/D-alanyl-D-alanine-endopeptidase [Rhodoferax lacus]RFO96280.1 D-alanyl-D-alanine carboxypeptidase/D-alanyl-D-alanine-endopeptidase [Rhodoferax lacus]